MSAVPRAVEIETPEQRLERKREQARINGRKSRGKPRIISTNDARMRVFQIAKSGRSPVDIMFDNMCFWHGQALQLTQNIADGLRELDLTDPQERREVMTMLNRVVEARGKSQDCAVDLAPYIHPRLANVTFKQAGPEDGTKPESIPLDDPVAASQVYQRLIAGPASEE